MIRQRCSALRAKRWLQEAEDCTWLRQVAPSGRCKLMPAPMGAPGPVGRVQPIGLRGRLSIEARSGWSAS